MNKAPLTFRSVSNDESGGVYTVASRSRFFCFFVLFAALSSIGIPSRQCKTGLDTEIQVILLRDIHYVAVKMCLFLHRNVTLTFCNLWGWVGGGTPQTSVLVSQNEFAKLWQQKGTSNKIKMPFSINKENFSTHKLKIV